MTKKSKKLITSSGVSLSSEGSVVSSRSSSASDSSSSSGSSSSSDSSSVSVSSSLASSSLGFRLQANSFFLTYSQVGDVVLETLTNAIITKIKPLADIESFTASCEFHKDKGRHFHILFTLKKRLRVRDPSFFDYLDLHPNIQVTRNSKKVLKYILKDFKKNSKPGKDVLYSSFSLEDLGPLMGEISEKVKKTNKSQLKDEISLKVYLDIVSGKPVSLTDSMKELITSDSAYVLRNYKKIYQSLTYIKVQTISIDPSTYIDFFRFDFSFAAGVCSWIMFGYKSHVLCLIGETRIGKSSLAYQLGGKFPLIINELNGLVHLIPGHHTSIIFNDFAFPDINNDNLSSMLALFDSKFPSSIRILFQSVFIPGSLRKIITSNDDLSLKFKPFPALEARMLYVYLAPSIRSHQESYSIHIPRFTPCAYGDNSLISGPPNCITSSVIHSFFINSKRELLLQKQYDEFKRVFPFKISEEQLLYLKQLNRYFFFMKQRFPKEYVHVSIYHAFQSFTIKTRPVIRVDDFIIKCLLLYKNYHSFQKIVGSSRLNSDPLHEVYSSIYSPSQDLPLFQKIDHVDCFNFKEL